MPKRPTFSPEELIMAYMAVRKAGYDPMVTDAICSKLFANASLKRRGRPPKRGGIGVEADRAAVVDYYQSQHAELTVGEAIAHALSVEDALQLMRRDTTMRSWLEEKLTNDEMRLLDEALDRPDMSALFPRSTATGTLVQSVSRGRASRAVAKK